MTRHNGTSSNNIQLLKNEYKELANKLNNLVNSTKGSESKSVLIFRSSILASCILFSGTINSIPRTTIKNPYWINLIALIRLKLRNIIPSRYKRMIIKCEISDWYTFNLMESFMLRHLVVTIVCALEASLDHIITENNLEGNIEHTGRFPNLLDNMMAIFTWLNIDNSKHIEFFDAIIILRNKCAHSDVVLDEYQINKLNKIKLPIDTKHNEPILHLKHIYIFINNSLCMLHSIEDAKHKNGFSA